jgi:hypothetical protein
MCHHALETGNTVRLECRVVHTTAQPRLNHQTLWTIIYPGGISILVTYELHLPFLCPQRITTFRLLLRSHFLYKSGYSSKLAEQLSLQVTRHRYIILDFSAIITYNLSLVEINSTLFVIMLRHIFALIAAFAMFSIAAANCQLGNSYTDADAGTESRSQLCVGQGPDSWTFAMDISQVSVPTFNGGSPLAGVSGNKAYLIYDNTCALRGVYAPSGNDCGTPYTIEENWLPFVLTVTSINTGVGSGYFSFNYGAGKYSINNNGCGCSDMSSGLEAEQGCKCAFPIAG